ncbi:putative 3-deoxy-D-arabino-heptulosonate 7-phosphate synthase isoenzyme [Tilletiaria anomala UBC 951]|uniref:3-deoxy-7-phosphoheptulonate synthase n=1 Tax=Tilletiaria anomala (strain ATCC 24038 / CBS 436.72 / UBC 951) TaxID=1037660 RepID=A0A066WIB7_TILAU|nr:putative 3-deoxy-D-arabino-heptulosonate 7-phosphate synthase isoenzyme [Tilletiaria anomala UBC 951]KDN50420.1 putative 3-deoxy-D-arabino-heptulosonate 7-phosphate synthase isoenzyme [Tilletiaria anomala UBC 951]
MTSTPIAFKDALNELDDRRIKVVRPLIPPQILVEEYPLTMTAAQTILKGRRATEDIIKGDDDRLVVIVGPCSVHDVKAGLEYAARLKSYADEATQDLHIVMRVYFEKPRTTVGWKGLINDPNLNGSYQINKGLKLARGLLLEVANMGLPAGTEFLDTISPQYTADLISWGAIGARTTESQVHRELTSGLSMSVGFKNGTDGSIDIAVDAIKAASSPHVFLSVTKQGISGIVETKGNDACHVILRGANSGPNYSPQHIKDVSGRLKKAGLRTKVMVDCSHGNSEKKHENQTKVVDSLVQQLSEGETGDNIVGVMLESNLVEGKQSIPPSGPQDLKYGQSVTDACINWETTVSALNKLRQGVQARRQKVRSRAASGDLNGSLASSISSLKEGINDAFLATHDSANGVGSGFNDQHLATLGKNVQ